MIDLWPTARGGPVRRSATAPWTLSAILVLALAACQAQPPGGVGPTTGGPPAASAGERPAAAATADPESPATADPETETETDPATPIDLSDLDNRPATVAALPGLDDAPDPQALIGEPAATVESLLGPPHFRRREAPAEIWQYRGADCVMDFFVYDEADGPRVLHLEARSLNVLQIGQDACLRHLVGEYRSPTGG